MSDSGGQTIKPKTRNPAGKPMRFTRLQLENWRNFARVDVELPSRVFLVGPNASGKSNLLDVFSFLHDIASAGGGLQDAVSMRGGVSSLRCLAARRNPDVSLRVQVGNEQDPAAWEYYLKLSQGKGRRPIIKEESVRNHEQAIVSRPDPDDNKDKERLTQTHLEQVNANREFRELAEFFASVSYRHIVPVLVREPLRSIGFPNDPYGGDFLAQMAQKHPRTRNAFLKRIREVLQALVPQLSELDLMPDSTGALHLTGKYQHWRPRGALQTEEVFSDGTLRLIGLLWAILDGAGPLLLEEPELSLHPEVIRRIPQMFYRMQRRTGRQVLVSTHSSDLLQDSGIGLDEVLLLLPGVEGTSVRTAFSFPDVVALLEGGASLADALMPKTAPARPNRLAMFGS